MPRFVFDYLVGGCNRERGVVENRTALADVRLTQRQLRPAVVPSLECTILGHTYSAPFGIAPIGLQGLMWPNAPEILARAAVDHNVPFVLSTVSSSSLERIAEVSDGNAWFQLYNPTDETIRTDLFERLGAARYQVLVVTVDVPTFGFRPRDIRNGLAMPPNLTVQTVWQMAARPRWLLATAVAGKPEMKTLRPYLSKKNVSGSELAEFMNKTVMGPVDADSLKAIRDRWPGRLVIKGILHEDDAEDAARLGADAIVVSNHGARQCDVGESPLSVLKRLQGRFKDRMEIYMDSGLRSGPDVACALASGAQFTFLGRAFVYGVAALGGRGGIHVINSLKMQLTQVMGQLRCSSPEELSNCLAADS